MRYKNVHYKGKVKQMTQELRQLWEVQVYIGNPDAKKPKTKKETVLALNAVDAVRRCGTRKVAKPPKPLFFVTWPAEEGGPVHRINSTAGPTDEEIKPTIKEK